MRGWRRGRKGDRVKGVDVQEVGREDRTVLAWCF
jgi:hypothetical protein